MIQDHYGVIHSVIIIRFYLFRLDFIEQRKEKLHNAALPRSKNISLTHVAHCGLYRPYFHLKRMAQIP